VRGIANARARRIFPFIFVFIFIFLGSASTSLVAYCRFKSMWSVCPCIGTDTAPLQERIKQPVQADIC
jgi:hypothetical protein